jgi:ribonuclease PH
MSTPDLDSAVFQRRDGRQPADLRPISIDRRYTRAAPGSVLIRAGDTIVLCTASVDESLPPWMKKDQTRGWVTAEYNMLPGSTAPRTSVAAISLGLVDDRLLLDLDYSEDVRAQVDSNIVMTGAGEFVEIQGTAEGRTFTRKQLDAQLDLALAGIRHLTNLQREALAADWPIAGVNS